MEWGMRPSRIDVYKRQVRVDAVLRQQIPQGVLRRGALAGGHDGPARQIRHGLDGIAIRHNIQHAQGIHRQGDDAAVRPVIQHGGQVGRHAGDVQLPLHQLGGQTSYPSYRL